MVTAIDANTALVLIDFQKAILRAKAAHPVKEVLAKAVLLVDAFREAGLPLVAVKVNPAGAKWLQTRVEESSLPKNAMVQKLVLGMMSAFGLMNIAAAIKTQNNDIFITKKTWNAFYDTPLQEELQKRNITQLVLAGVSTSIGVEGTARAAAELGYNVVFATDAMTDRIAAAHDNSIKYIFPRIGELDTTERIVNRLRGKV